MVPPRWQGRRRSRANSRAPRSPGWPVGERHQVERAVDVDVKRSDGGRGGRGAGRAPFRWCSPWSCRWSCQRVHLRCPACWWHRWRQVTNAAPAVLEPPSRCRCPPTGTRSEAWMPIPLSGLSSSSAHLLGDAAAVDVDRPRRCTARRASVPRPPGVAPESSWNQAELRVVPREQPKLAREAAERAALVCHQVHGGRGREGKLLPARVIGSGRCALMLNHTLLGRQIDVRVLGRSVAGQRHVRARLSTRRAGRTVRRAVRQRRTVIHANPCAIRGWNDAPRRRCPATCKRAEKRIELSICDVRLDSGC